MKRFSIITIFSVLFVAPLFYSFVCAKESYEWQQIAALGKGCFPPNCAEGQFPMAIVPLVAFDGKLYSIGNKRVWTSADGVNWNSQPKTDWDDRYGMRFAFFNKRLWMLGGMKTWDDFRSDVWSSEDGVNWQMVFTNSPWSTRSATYSAAFNDKLWLFGGKTGRADSWTGDVWAMGRKTK